MVDLAISGAIASLKAAGEIAGSFLKVRDVAMVQGKVIELQSVILAAQQSALAAQGEQFALLEEKRGLEKQIADLEAWGREKQRYELRAVAHGAFVRTLKPDAAGAEPPHPICANCYERGKKRILQSDGLPGVYGGTENLKCGECGEVVQIPHVGRPLPPVQGYNSLDDF